MHLDVWGQDIPSTCQSSEKGKRVVKPTPVVGIISGRTVASMIRLAPITAVVCFDIDLQKLFRISKENFGYRNIMKGDESMQVLNRGAVPHESEIPCAFVELGSRQMMASG